VITRRAAIVCCISFGTSLAAGPKTGTVQSKDGVSIAYTSEGTGQPAIVFIHGWTCDQSHWRFQVPEFSKTNRVITIDLPGHGKSGANRDTWSINGLGGDVATIVHHLKLKKVILVGHSMGAPVALVAAARLQGIAVGVVAADALQNVEFTISPEAADRMLKSFEADFDGARTRFFTSMFKDPKSPILASILKDAPQPDPKAAVALMRDFSRFDFKGALASAGVPVRAINADGRYKTAVEINRKYGDFDAVMMKDVGHFLMLEKPDEFNHDLRSIIQQLANR